MEFQWFSNKTICDFLPLSKIEGKVKSFFISVELSLGLWSIVSFSKKKSFSLTSKNQKFSDFLSVMVLVCGFLCL